ncbi:MAG: CDP-glucose 4,6-dehydratase [Geobacteraceae bacterium GWC2_55_20]|nr:MAG: CDP-glucose 4,6-dehydratase [Geobacteraceae bacterium GWC2_55_20]OGU26494.1 MAG: CDP-glucose 4,6-dehydratase [Geobacteraceae bacterium GWF2_54_21]HCE67772.1 CDP-glucose 4,6-dehydratase [Geobacter sp.]
MDQKTFWHGKRVFITGHTGFKGSWLCLLLNRLGAEVTGYALDPPTDPSLFELARIGELVTSITADVRDGERLAAEMAGAVPEIVIHMAAQPLVRDSYKIPVETYSTNVMGTVNLLEAVRHTPGIRAVVNVTTDKVYENREWAWGYRENEPFGGHDPYSNSKACSELVTAAYRSSYFNPSEYARHGVAPATARAGNVIGGGDWAGDRLIPDILRAVLAGEPVSIRNPRAIRPWQHVLEPLSGYLLLAQKLFEKGPEYATGWNFGPSDEDARPVEWLAGRICELWGEQAAYRIDDGIHPHEAHYLKLDCSKVRAELGWRPRWGLEKALESIVVWTRSYRDGKDLRLECLRQITEYGESA